MAPCLSKFPLVCLDAIFSHVSLYDLFYSVGLVCTSWHKSRRTALLRRRRLGLIQCEEHNHETLNIYRALDCFYGTELIERVRRDDGSPWHTLESLEKYKFNCLSVPGGVLTVPFIASLTTNFTKITRLHVNVTLSTSEITQFIRLIEHYSEHLVELKIGNGFYLENGFEDAAREHALNIANLFDSINRLQSLRHLNLRLYNLPFRPPPLSCLARLATFAVYVFGGYDWIIASIKQYAQNVTSIELYNEVDIREKFDAQLARKFIVLNVEFYEDDEDDEDFDRMQAMNQFCTQFSSLIKLTLCSISDPMTMLARYLSLLTQLVHLDLYFDHIAPIEEVQPLVEEAEEGEGEDDEQGQEEAQQQITQVLSVRLLSIHLLFTESHRDSERLFIPEIFPNIQVLRLHHDIAECPDCEIRPMTYDSDNSDDEFDRIEQDIDPDERARRIAECIRLTRQPFRRCANLHTVALILTGRENLINLDNL